MKFLCICATPILLLAPMLAQQPAPQGNPPPPQGAGQNQQHMQHQQRHPRMQQQGGDRERERDEREQMSDEREDLGELGLPYGPFWQNPELAMRIHLTPDQTHRLADAYLQGRLKIIQLEANEEMEEARLDNLESSPTMDSNEALAATDRLADARAATEKADAHLAFSIRAVLTADQLMMLRNGFMHGGMEGGRREYDRQAGHAGPQAQAGPTQPQL